MGKSLSLDIRERVVALVDEGLSCHGAARRLRQTRTRLLAEDFKAWSEAQLGRVSGKSALAKAFRYALRRWPSFTLFP